ncbi:MAG: NAD(P)/FAD-dependent oxidoreductase [Flavobacteriaceae bacterium]
MKIGIVGGGFMGLVLAHELSKTKVAVKVFERESQSGGLATYYDYGSFIWDKFYHVILPTDIHLINLAEDLGLTDVLQWRPSFTGYYVQKKFHSISNIKEFLLFPPLGIFHKMMLGFTIFYGSRINNWKKLEKISVKDWLIKVGGRKTFEKFWEPLLLAKLGENYEQVSAVFIWTYIKRLFQARGSAVNKEHMGYISGGYKTVLDKLEASLSETGSQLKTEANIDHIAAAPQGGIYMSINGVKEHFDKVIFTAPLNVLEKTTAPELFEISKADKAVEYLGVICLVLVTSEPLTPYYVLNIADKKIPFTGVIGMSSLVDLEETDNKYITYFPRYITADHEYWSRSDDELEALFLKGVQELYPEFKSSEIISSHINKAFKVQPLQVLNYSDIVPKIQTKHPDFYVLNTSQFVNDTLNNNSVVKHIGNFMTSFEQVLKKETSPKTED